MDTLQVLVCYYSFNNNIIIMNEKKVINISRQHNAQQGRKYSLLTSTNKAEEQTKMKKTNDKIYI